MPRAEPENLPTLGHAFMYTSRTPVFQPGRGGRNITGENANWITLGTTIRFPVPGGKPEHHRTGHLRLPSKACGASQDSRFLR